MGLGGSRALVAPAAVEAATVWEVAPGEKRPTRATPTTKRAGRAKSLRRRVSSERLLASGAPLGSGVVSGVIGGFIGGSARLEEEEAAEDGDPHEVDEV